MSGPAYGSVHLINLDRDQERLRLFRERNPHIAFERPHAVLGGDLDRAALAESGMIARHLRYSNPSLGNAFSHVSLWSKAVAMETPVTIAEDDAIFARSFVPQADAFIRNLPGDWDLVLWGWNFDAHLWVELFGGVRMKASFDQDDLRQRISEFQADDAARAAIRLRHSFGVMAYTVSPRGGKGLIDHCLPLVNATIRFPGFDFQIDNKTIDCAMNRAYPKLKAFACFSPLAMSENRHETSTIQGRT